MVARSALRKAKMPTKSRKGPKPGLKTRIKAAPKLGKLPEWNLTDLYASIDAPEIARDLDQVD
jgi:oligoendopeptidase F